MADLLADRAVLGLAAALGCGMLVGIEREQKKNGDGDGAGARPGMRSVTLVALIGALSQLMAPGLVIVAACLIVALCVLLRLERRESVHGMASELALFLSFLLGVACIERPLLAGAAAVSMASMLHLSARLHQFTRDTLTRTELRDADDAGRGRQVSRSLPPRTAAPGCLRMWGHVVEYCNF